MMLKHLLTRPSRNEQVLEEVERLVFQATYSITSSPIKPRDKMAFRPAYVAVNGMI
jgi:hypothetical protein